MSAIRVEAMIIPGERAAIRAAIEAGRRYGYGNMIACLKWAWARHLMACGVSAAAAREWADTDGYNPTRRLPHGGLDDLMKEEL